MIKIELIEFHVFYLNALFNELKIIIFILVTCYNHILVQFINVLLKFE
jgi:hypothetical protein